MKALLSALTVGVCAVACTDNSGQTKPLSQEIVESRGLVDFYCGNSHKDSLATSGWDYVSGLVANAVLKAYELYPEKSEYIDAVRDYANYSTSEDGNEIFKRPKNVTALGESNVDDLAAGKIYFPLIKDALSKGDTALANRYNNALTLIVTRNVILTRCGSMAFTWRQHYTASGSTTMPTASRATASIPLGAM
jgi:unsaturated rhamnogalacturonyl hydrolase